VIPTIWPRRRTAAAPTRQRLAEVPALTFTPTAFTGPLDPAEDPTHCCEAREDLTALISHAKQVHDGAEVLLADLAQRLVELEARHR
jgi:hypothetical protein